MSERRSGSAGFWPIVPAIFIVQILFRIFLDEITLTPPWTAVVMGGLLFGTATSLAWQTRQRPLQEMVGFGIAYTGLMFGFMAGGRTYTAIMMTMAVGVLVALVLRSVLPKREDIAASPSRLPQS